MHIHTNTHTVQQLFHISVQNESFHNTVWSFAPKVKVRGLRLIEIAAQMAACQFNNGMIAFARVMDLLKIPAGTHLQVIPFH